MYGPGSYVYVHCTVMRLPHTALTTLYYTYHVILILPIYLQVSLEISSFNWGKWSIKCDAKLIHMHGGFSHLLMWLLSMHPPQRMAPNERIHSHLGLVQLGWLHSRSAWVQSSFHSQCIPLLPLDPATMTGADSSHLCVYSKLTTTFKIIHWRVPGGLEHFSYEVCW